jgi:hypothetical protein
LIILDAQPPLSYNALGKNTLWRISKMTDLLEALMIICFGLSWPVSIRKSYISRTAKGKSLFFEVFIWIGYVFGITRKIIQITNGQAEGWLFYMGFIFYILNILEISIDMLLYARNIRLDKLAESKEKS